MSWCGTVASGMVHAAVAPALLSGTPGIGIGIAKLAEGSIGGVPMAGGDASAGLPAAAGVWAPGCAGPVPAIIPPAIIPSAIIPSAIMPSAIIRPAITPPATARCSKGVATTAARRRAKSPPPAARSATTPGAGGKDRVGLTGAVTVSLTLGLGHAGAHSRWGRRRDCHANPQQDPGQSGQSAPPAGFAPPARHSAPQAGSASATPAGRFLPGGSCSTGARRAQPPGTPGIAAIAVPRCLARFLRHGGQSLVGTSRPPRQPGGFRCHFSVP